MEQPNNSRVGVKVKKRAGDKLFGKNVAYTRELLEIEFMWNQAVKTYTAEERDRDMRNLTRKYKRR